MPDSRHPAILVLAAGSSRRLGHPKQLLQYQDKTLIRHSAETALLVSPHVCVILGAHAEACREELSGLKVTTHLNPDFESGMSTSIRLGIIQTSGFAHTLILLCDQPLLTTDHLHTLLSHASEHPEHIIASGYGEIPGVPALFPQSRYESLLTLQGDKGAKGIILRDERTVTIPLPLSEQLDIDTESDLQTLRCP